MFFPIFPCLVLSEEDSVSWKSLCLRMVLEAKAEMATRARLMTCWKLNFSAATAHFCPGFALIPQGPGLDVLLSLAGSRS